MAEFEALIARVGADRIGGFIAEPIQASGGVIVPPEGYLSRMWEVCQRHDILFIADEVVTAFGRLGHWFASWDEFGVQPDMITTAKGLTSGYVPLGALIFSDRIWDVMAEDGDALVHRRLHLFRPSGVLCGGSEEHRDHGARGSAGQCRHGRRLFRDPAGRAGGAAAGRPGARAAS